MYPFIETIRIVDGRIQNLSYHQMRLERTLHHFFPSSPVWKLEDFLREIPSGYGIYKARVLYDNHGFKEVEYAPYVLRQIRRLQLVCCDDIDYRFKSADRSRLLALAAKKMDADEIVIVKHGLLTDTSYSNIALFDGKSWVTPRVPLLRGTMRQFLLDSGSLVEADIRPDQLSNFRHLALINAMMPLGMCNVGVEHIAPPSPAHEEV